MDNIIEAVIFDMDGVIIDSEPVHYKVNKEIFAELDIEMSRSEYNSYIGTSNSEMWAMIKDRHDLSQDVEYLVGLQQKKNMEHIINGEIVPVDGVLRLFEELNESSIELALGSSSPKNLIDKVIEQLDIKDFFKVVESGENVENGKPDPDLFKKIADDLDILVERIVVIEDSHNGVKAAKKAGMNCVGYVNNNSGDQDLSPADLIIDDFNQLSVMKIKEM